MISICSGCDEIFHTELKQINAKQINPKICKTPEWNARNCLDEDCFYFDYENGCVNFLFCEKCASDRKIVSETFERFADIN